MKAFVLRRSHPLVITAILSAPKETIATHYDLLTHLDSSDVSPSARVTLQMGQSSCGIDDLTNSFFFSFKLQLK